MRIDLKPQKVLVVDDDCSMVEEIETKFKKGIPGIEVITAFDGNEAVKLFQEHLPAVVVLNFMIPEKNGFWVVLELKERGMTSRNGAEEPPIIIMITSDRGMIHREFASGIGVWAYLVKSHPFFMGMLSEKVQEAVSKMAAKYSN